MDSNTMKMIKEEVVNLIEQFFREQKWEKALSGMKEDVMTIKPPFSARRFEELITSTDLKSATKYLSGYTKSQTNELSNILFYYLHRQETANDMCIGDPFALERFSSGGGFEPRPDTATFISRARSEFVERVRAIQLVTKTLDDIIARMRKFALVLQTELITESKRLIPQIPDFDSGSVSSCRLIELLNQRGNLPCAVGFLVVVKTALNEIGLAETKKDFIDNDLQRLFSVHKKLLDARAEGYTVDLVPFANDTTNEMFQMMNHLVATNPDLLQKKDFSSQMRFI